MAPLNYDPKTDPRFTKDYSASVVDRLDKHGFPIIPEQPKDVHRLGKGLGSSLNYYRDQALQLFIQGRLKTVTGVDLDNFGLQYGTPRLSGEDDESYRLRLQALFSPRKVTKPFITDAANAIITTNPRVSLSEPWRQVLHFDNNLKPDEGCFDVGDSYMWSPDYWRSGVAVVKSGLSTGIQGTIQSLVAEGILLHFEQYDLEVSTLKLPVTRFIESHVNRMSTLDTEFWFDHNFPSNFDDPKYSYDINPFFYQQTYKTFYNYMVSNVVLRFFPQAQATTPGMTSVLNNPALVFDSTASSTDTYDTLVEVITDWPNKINATGDYTESTTTLNTALTLVSNVKKGKWLNYGLFETVSTTLTIGDQLNVTFEGESEAANTETITLVDRVGIEWIVSFTDSITLTAVESEGLVATRSFTDLILFDTPTSDLSAPKLTSNITIGANRQLSRLVTITLHNPYETVLGQFVLRIPATPTYTTLGNPNKYYLDTFFVSPNLHDLSETDRLNGWRLSS